MFQTITQLDFTALFLVMGLRTDAKRISVTEDFGAGAEILTFDPTYFCLDITDRATRA